MKNILLIPVGNIDTKIIEEIKRAIEGILPLKARISKSVEIIEGAFNSRRGQYHSTSIIRELLKLRNGYELILGITDVDLYVPGLNFVFGEADILNGTAIISLKRLREEFYRSRPDHGLFIKRAIKEAIHEIGHLYGLDHCHDRRCIMFFSNSIRDTDIKGPEFCKSCRRKLGY